MTSPFVSAESCCRYLERTSCPPGRISRFRSDMESGSVHGQEWTNLKKRVTRIFREYLLDAFKAECTRYDERLSEVKLPSSDPLSQDLEPGLRRMIVTLRCAEALVAPLNHVAYLLVIDRIRSAVKRLHEGEIIAIPGGWASLPDYAIQGHFAIQLIRRGKTDYSLTTLNSAINPINRPHCTKGTIPLAMTKNGLEESAICAHLLVLKHLAGRLLQARAEEFFGTKKERSTLDFYTYLNQRMYDFTRDLQPSALRIPHQSQNDCVARSSLLYKQYSTT